MAKVLVNDIYVKSKNTPNGITFLKVHISNSFIKRQSDNNKGISIELVPLKQLTDGGNTHKVLICTNER